MDFVKDNPQLIVWLLTALGGMCLGLIIYIWQEHRKREREDASGIKSTLTTAINNMEQKLERAVSAMEVAVSALGKSIGDKLDSVEARLDTRIDEVEKKQTLHCAAITKNEERIRGVVAVCRERASHCPLSKHMHARELDLELQPHRRSTDLLEG